MNTWPEMPLLTELHHAGRRGADVPSPDRSSPDVPAVDLKDWFGAGVSTSVPPLLPALSEPDVVRHYTALSRRNHGVDNGFYPLGSCTMKYNPKRNEAWASLPGFTDLHPMQPDADCQGALQLLYELGGMLCALTGMDAATLQPAAGAQGESTGLSIIRAYHLSRRDPARTKILVPDSSHGTNPASASLAGFEVVVLPSDARGCVSPEVVRRAVGPDTAGLMLTNPNTLGLFEPDIAEITEAVHTAGGLLYYDGANLNAIMGIARPGDMGFDIAHINVHKTLSTPHGGGGPGAGPVMVKDYLAPFLPVPVIVHETDGYHRVSDRPFSIGRVRGFDGNFLVLVRAYAYIRSYGPDGLKRVSELAVLHANYLRSRLADAYDMPFPGLCMHEFVLSATRQAQNGATALVLAKNLIDAGIHPPTIYFPLTVKEAMMVEPTETESLETLDQFVDEMLRLAALAQTDPAALMEAPVTTPVRRLDEVGAARKPVLCACLPVE